MLNCILAYKKNFIFNKTFDTGKLLTYSAGRHLPKLFMAEGK